MNTPEVPVQCFPMPATDRPVFQLVDIAPDFRAELLATIKGEEPPRQAPCNGWANGCDNCLTSPRCSRRKAGSCTCEVKRPNQAGICKNPKCRRAVPGFYEAQREAA
jgi:hypothetical protein